VTVMGRWLPNKFVFSHTRFHSARQPARLHTEGERRALGYLFSHACDVDKQGILLALGKIPPNLHTCLVDKRPLFKNASYLCFFPLAAPKKRVNALRAFSRPCHIIMGLRDHHTKV
jgi:hypothetical protein